VLYCSSFSKTISPGLRLGWIEAGRWHDRVESLKMLINLGASSVPQIATTLFLRDGGFTRHLRRLRLDLGRKVAALRESVLTNFPEGTHVTDPSGGMVLWISLPDGISSMDVYRQALERSIMVAPGRVFSLQNRFDSQLRLNAGVWEPATEEKIRVLGDIAKSLCVARKQA